MFERVRERQFLRHNAVFFAGSMAVGALNYLYYPVLSRLVEPGTFGEIQTLVSLFLQLGIFLAVVSMVIVNIVSNYSESERGKFVFEFEKLALLVSLIILILALAFARQLQDRLNFESPWPFAILGLATVASVPFYIRGAYLRGLQRFGQVSLGNILAAGAKLVLSAVLVVAGLGTAGAIGGVVLAQILACALIAWWAYQAGLRSPSPKKLRLPNLKTLAPELRYGGVVLVASLAITLQYSIDIVVIKYYFDPEIAGLYAGIAAVARIMFFLTASISQVLISKVQLHGDAAQNRQVLQKSLILFGGLSMPALILMLFFPEQIAGLLMGGTYSTMANLLPMLSLSVFIVAAINLLTAYYLAMRRLGIALLAAVGSGFTFLFILLHHGSPMDVVESLLLGSAITLLSIGVWILTERRYGA